MKTEGEAAPAILMLLLLLGKAAALGCHFKAFPSINQRPPPPPTPAARAPLPAPPAAFRKGRTMEPS